MKNETKLKKLMSFLDENGIKYTTPRKRKEGSAHLFIGQYMIAVKIEGEDDTLFFNKHKRGKHPFFIRTSETPKFIIEKMQNLITRMMLIQQKHFMEQKNNYMERLNFKLEFADNVVIVTDNSSGFVNVYEEKENGDYHEYTKRAISESVDDIIAHLLLDGTENLKQKSIYKIKIEIR